MSKVGNRDDLVLSYPYHKFLPTVMHDHLHVSSTASRFQNVNSKNVLLQTISLHDNQNEIFHPLLHEH